MRITKFEDLIIWQEARELVKTTYSIISNTKFSKDFELKNQIRSVAISVINNIVERFERNSRKEFSYFSSISKGSLGEVRSLLYLAHDRGYLSETKFSMILHNSEKLSKRVFKLIISLIKIIKFPITCNLLTLNL